uniref:ATP synthase subunit a n=1 Tax=Mastinocerus sp. MAS01 TaxID=1205632 RepID=A0A0S2MP47_9COLE|nr:ATP synthase F0 subunit 6 [Mastinocerus sp. MAS01]
MMSNLFSMFDPSNNMNYSLNWSTTLIILLFIPLSFWIIPSRFNILWLTMYKKINTEINSVMQNSKSKKSKLILTSFFTLILLNNMLSMFTYIFPPSSHLVFSLSLALPFWLSLMIFNMKNKLMNFSASLVPQGTPIMIAPFMVLIELMSNMIRPMTLSIRLSTNITAGHLIMKLIENMMEKEEILMKSAIVLQWLIIALEMMMTIIQAYVFSILSTMYLKETH